MRALVMRPERQARSTAARLEAAGHKAIVAPVLSVEIDPSPPRSTAVNAIIVTSINAVDALAPAGLPAVPVFAVGGRTCAALERSGFTHVTGAPDAAALAQIIARTMAPAPLLFVAGRDRKVELEASLARAGFRIEVWEAYRAVAVGSLPEPARAALSGRYVDVVLHYSRRSAETALTLVRSAGLEREFAAVLHLCLSADVAEGLESLAQRRIDVAARPDEDALMDALDSFARTRIAGSLTPQS
jgi:uroporphyrinogen-III synthase